MADSIAGDIAAVQRIEVIPRILEVVCRTTGMGFAAVARVTADRWVACAVRDDIDFGLEPGGELEIATTICDEIRDTGEAVLIDDVATDPDYCGHPTPQRYGFKSYVSVPIVSHGEFFGTLCAIDPRPAKVKTPEVQGMFELFAELIALHLQSQRRLELSEAALLTARETAELRDQFIAVLGHDLRNPLASIDGGARLLQKTPLDIRSQSIVAMMHSSVARMTELIENILDFARGQLGGGVPVDLKVEPNLAGVLFHVIDELSAGHHERVIETDLQIAAPVVCDAGRISQLLSNLLGNAMTHGSLAEPVRVSARTTAEALEIEVTNGGAAISAAAMSRLFQPFARGAVKHQQGLGLGLYIAAEIAKAHGGVLTAASDSRETRFAFRMPLDAGRDKAPGLADAAA